MSILRMVLVLAIALATPAAYASDFVAGELLVKYKSGIVRTRSSKNAVYSAAGVKHVKRFGGILVGLEQVVISSNVKMRDAIAAFQKDPSVEYVQPNYILRAFPNRPVARNQVYPTVRTHSYPCWWPGIPFPPFCEDEPMPDPEPDPDPTPTPDPTPGVPDGRPAVLPPPAEVNPPVVDPDLAKAYGLGKISAQDAWEHHRGLKSFVVAVIDTGIDYNHEDLAYNVWRKKDAHGVETVGYDAIHDDGYPFDDHKHGTHTSGTVGAVGGNGIGVSGVSPVVSVMGVKFLDKDGSGTTADAIRAISFAVANGAKVLSNSWGGPAEDEGQNRALYDAIEQAKNQGVLFVAAAGNDGTDDDKRPTYPASFTNDNMLTVAALDKNDRMPYWSNYGKTTVHVGAPGVDVYSTIPGNRYEKESGTSMACPHVAGAAALIWSKHPQWNYKQVKDALMNTVDPVAALDGKTVTGGRINVSKALSYMD